MTIHPFAALALAVSAGALAQATASTPPAKDSRGIAVVSAPATAPPGTNVPVSAPAGTQLIVNPDQAAAFTPAAGASADLPPCTKTVTDRCTQAYEGKRAAASGPAHARRHKHSAKRPR